MNKNSMLRGMVLAAIIVCSAIPASAALSPEKVAKLKSNATEVFMIEVTDVTVVDPKAAHSATVLTAKVTKVERSSRRTMPGEQIEIASYRLAPLDSKKKLTDAKEIEEHVNALLLRLGPKVPPNIEAGWTGKVYLKSIEADEKQARYGLAAFGHSFEPVEDKPTE